jgi:hypothetical protein
LKDAPDDIVLQRMEQDATSGDAHDAVCARQRTRAESAKDDPGVQYLATRCLPDGAAKDDAFRALHTRWPNDPWAALATGYLEAEHASWSKAIEPLRQAQKSLPAMSEYVALDLARVLRANASDGRNDLQQLAKNSDQLQQMLTLEAGDKVQGPMLAYRSLASGKLDESLSVISGDEQEPRLLRLIAASDGASRAEVKKAIALPTEAGLDADTVWPALALATREHAHPEAFEDIARKAAGSDADAMLAFVRKVQVDRAAAEAALASLRPELRGHAYSMGAILLGDRCPAQWREQAKRLLFAVERPWFT